MVMFGAVSPGGSVSADGLNCEQHSESAEKQLLFCGVFPRLKRGTRWNSDNTACEYHEGQQGVCAVIAQRCVDAHCTLCTASCLCLTSVVQLANKDVSRCEKTAVLCLLLLPSTTLLVQKYCKCCCYHCCYCSTSSKLWSLSCSQR